MASEEDFEMLEKDRAGRRQADRLDQEFEPTDLKHKSAEEELRETKEALKKEREARMKLEGELQSLLAKHKGPVTPTKKGTSGSDGKLSTASRVFRDQLIDIF